MCFYLVFGFCVYYSLKDMEGLLHKFKTFFRKTTFAIAFKTG
jgi:hypothetical protein